MSSPRETPSPDRTGLEISQRGSSSQSETAEIVAVRRPDKNDLTFTMSYDSPNKSNAHLTDANATRNPFSLDREHKDHCPSPSDVDDQDSRSIQSSLCRSEDEDCVSGPYPKTSSQLDCRCLQDRLAILTSKRHNGIASSSNMAGDASRQAFTDDIKNPELSQILIRCGESAQRARRRQIPDYPSIPEDSSSSCPEDDSAAEIEFEEDD
ncbi:uncharacterized protein IL334_002306 [Kwoniella shivajii]|uniref:Uncharacterized protein n=1 Tax=Kwoniella shivajii TaxID=564305 RepID=A0ABZ1CUC6_9TREE|nr:hypothetical protein IL334_002306 [Kwoniella shivajii]